jgi:sugar lactone lactonase YvrE
VQEHLWTGIGGPRLLIFHQPLATDLAPDVVLMGGGSGGLLFDPDGNLYGAGGFYVVRLLAPIGPDSVSQFLAGPFRNEVVTARPDRDSEGNIYSTGTPWPEGPNSDVYIFDAPFHGEPVRIGRERLSNRSLWGPTLVAVDRSSSPNHLYVVDSHNRVLGWRDAAGFANGAPADLVLNGSAPEDPYGESCDSLGIVHVVNASRFCVNGFALGGLAVDSRGNLWLSDVQNHRVLEFDRPFEKNSVADRVLGQGGSFTTRVCGSGATGLCHPGALAFDEHDNLYVADLHNDRVLLFLDPLRDSVADKVFGQGCRGAFPNSLCLGYEEGDINVHFFAGSGLAVDPQGNLYVADSYNTRVLIFKDAARSDTFPDAVLGQDNFRTSLQGTGPRRFGGQGYLTLFPGPSGLAIGPRGELYVADSQNDRLLVFEHPLRPLSGAEADRVFGHADFETGGVDSPVSSLTPPPASATRLLRPTGLAFDAQGNLYVADSWYNRVLAFERP